MSSSTSDVLFFMCPQGHKRITWTGNIAKCEICGLTSENVAALIQRGRDTERQAVIAWLRGQARLIRKAAGGPQPGTAAVALEVAAQMLADRARGIGLDDSDNAPPGQ